MMLRICTEASNGRGRSEQVIKLWPEISATLCRETESHKDMRLRRRSSWHGGKRTSRRGEASARPRCDCHWCWTAFAFCSSGRLLPSAWRGMVPSAEASPPKGQIRWPSSSSATMGGDSGYLFRWSQRLKQVGSYLPFELTSVTISVIGVFAFEIREDECTAELSKIIIQIHDTFISYEKVIFRKHKMKNESAIQYKSQGKT